MKPAIVLSDVGGQCLTLFWKDAPGFHVGYRFMEHSPEAAAAPLVGIDSQPSFAPAAPPAPDGALLSPSEFEDIDPWGKSWLRCYDESRPDDPRQLRFRSYADGPAVARGLDNGGAQERQIVLQPLDDGMRMWMTLKTNVAVPGALAVQQCLRFSGATAKEWRLQVACIPFLSEFDVQARVDPLETLTWARLDGRWLKFPVQYACYHTLPGLPLAAGRTSGAVDHGLIVRESLDRRFASGMYWERTAYVSNRHHADCLHAAVDFGPLEAGQSRTIQGRFYFVNGTRDDLLSIFDKERVS